MRTKINTQKLIDISPNPFEVVAEGIVGEGIITKLQSYNPPWGELNINLDLDMYYYGNVSGNKIISPLVEKLLNSETGVLEDEDLSILARIVYNMYNKKWDRLWGVFQSEYNPTENYNMVETGNETSNLTHGETVTRTDNLTQTRTDNLTHTKTGTETENPNITESRNQTINSNTTDNIYGFNSADASPANSGTQQNTNVDTMNRTGSNTMQYNTSDTDTGTQQNTNTGTETHAHTGTDENEKEHNLTRHGNIGVTTTQQMLQSEIELWQWDFFNNVLFPDIDRVLTIQIY